MAFYSQRFHHSSTLWTMSQAQCLLTTDDVLTALTVNHEHPLPTVYKSVFNNHSRSSECVEFYGSQINVGPLKQQKVVRVPAIPLLRHSI